MTNFINGSRITEKLKYSMEAMIGEMEKSRYDILTDS